MKSCFPAATKKNTKDETSTEADVSFLFEDDFDAKRVFAEKESREQAKARIRIERQLATPSLAASGSHAVSGCCGATCPLPKIKISANEDGGTDKTVILPLADADAVAQFAAACEAATVARGADTVVNKEIRTGFQLKCSQFTIENELEFTHDTLQPLLEKVKKGLGWDGPQLIAEPYKILLYTPGSFFKKHQDTERSPRMFGTLIVELPCKYTGAELSIFGPQDGGGRGDGSDEKPTHKFCWSGEFETGIRFTAFYADCYHCVSTLETRHRVVLNYCLRTAEPADGGATNALLDAESIKKTYFPDRIPPGIAMRAGMVREFADALCDYFNASDNEEDTTPHFFAVLSHQYTLRSLKEGIRLLKGRDRSIVKLLGLAKEEVWKRQQATQPQVQSPHLTFF